MRIRLVKRWLGDGHIREIGDVLERDAYDLVARGIAVPCDEVAEAEAEARAKREAAELAEAKAQQAKVAAASAPPRPTAALVKRMCDEMMAHPDAAFAAGEARREAALFREAGLAGFADKVDAVAEKLEQRAAQKPAEG